MSTLNHRTTERIPGVISETILAMNEFHYTFMDTGIFYFSTEHFHDDRHYLDRPGLLHINHFKCYARSIARTTKRPFVWAEGGDYREYDWTTRKRKDEVKFYVGLTMKQRKYFDPIIAPIRLLDGNSYDCPLTVRQDHTNYYVSFRGNIGKSLWQDFIHQCRTNPAYRKALKILRE